MKDNKSKHYIDALAGILTFVIFAGCILSVLFGGAGVYKRLVARDTDAYLQRSCTQYVAMKLRQAQSAESVSIVPFGQGEALRIAETISDREYATYIYCYDGFLRELFAAANESFTPEAGEKLLKCPSMSLAMNDGLVTASFDGDKGDQTAICIALRGWEGAA